MSVRESPEIAAVVRRLGEAWASRDFEAYSRQISRSSHFRGIGSDADEFWENADQFLNVRRVQAEELDEQGWGSAEGTLKRLDAFEDGSVGWASLVLALQTPAGEIELRATAVLTLEDGAWRVVQWHNSVPSPNVQTFGVELTTTLDELLTAVSEDVDALQTLSRPEGTMTLVFTDIVDSTALAERLGDGTWIPLIKDHETEIRRVTARHHGTVVKMLGDGSMLSFESARAAVRAALEVEAATGDEYAIRIGIHAGEVTRTEGDLLGITVNKAARIASAAEGGQILLSSVVAELAGPMADIEYGPPERITLKGLSGTHTVVAARRQPRT